MGNHSRISMIHREAIDTILDVDDAMILLVDAFDCLIDQRLGLFQFVRL